MTDSSEESRKGNRHLNGSIEGSDLEGLAGKTSWRGGYNDSVDSSKSSGSSGERTAGCKVFQAKGTLEYLRNWEQLVIKWYLNICWLHAAKPQISREKGARDKARRDSGNQIYQLHKYIRARGLPEHKPHMASALRSWYFSRGNRLLQINIMSNCDRCNEENKRVQP